MDRGPDLPGPPVSRIAPVGDRQAVAPRRLVAVRQILANDDVGWLRALGGYFSRWRAILPAERFNTGQRIWLHLALVPGGLVGLSGGLLYVPAHFGPPAGIALFIVHTGLPVALSALVVAHVYVAVLVHPSGLRAVFTGKSDEAYRREDHPLEVTGRRAQPVGSVLAKPGADDTRG